LVLINKSMESSNPDRRNIAKIGLEMTALLIRKNTDYGSSVFDPPLLCPELPPVIGILTRLSDKINRLVQLSQNENLVQSESFDDTISDLVGYGILYLVLRRRDESEV